MKSQHHMLNVILLLLFGVLIVILVNAVVTMQSDLVVLIVVIPAVVYAIISRKINIEEVKLPFISFKTAADQKISKFNLVQQTIPPSHDDLRLVGDKGFEAIEDMIKHYNLGDGRPIIMTLILGRHDYPKEDTLKFIEYLTRYYSFKFVILTNDKDEIEGYIEPFAILDILRSSSGEEFISTVNNFNKNAGIIFHDNRVKVITVKEGVSTELEALEMIRDNNTDAIVVIDPSNRRFKGILERGDVLSRVMIGLYKSLLASTTESDSQSK